MTGRVLIVLSGADRLPLKNGKYYETGFYLNELADPLKEFLDAGMEVDFTSPGGKKPAIDPTSKSALPPGKRDAALKLVEPREELWHPAPLEDWKLDMLDQHAAIFIPGGHAPMVDLRGNRDLGRILSHFHKNGKPTAAICHGPVGLLSCEQPDGSWIYRGYKMTCFSKLEERIMEEVARTIPGPVPYYVSDELRKAGARVKNSFLSFIPHVVRDRELITGQNPFAAEKLGKETVQAIREYIGKLTPYLSKPYPW